MDAVLMQVTTLQAGLATLVSFALGVCLCAIVIQMFARTRAKTRAEDLQRQIDGAKREAENIIKSAQIEAATEAIRKREEFTAEANQTRAELREAENRLSKREDALNRQSEFLQQQEKGLKEIGRAHV